MTAQNTDWYVSRGINQRREDKHGGRFMCPDCYGAGEPGTNANGTGYNTGPTGVVYEAIPVAEIPKFSVWQGEPVLEACFICNTYAHPDEATIDRFTALGRLVINNFAFHRHTEHSRYSHFGGGFSVSPDGDINNYAERVIALVTEYWKDRRPGYRDGVVAVPVPPADFFSPVSKLIPGEMLKGVYESRKGADGEEPRKALFAVRAGSKLPAQSCEIICYASSVLAEGEENDIPDEYGNWEIVSINASPTPGPTPITPETLMHNYFGSDSGTTLETFATDEEFVVLLREAFTYWKDKVMIHSSVGG